jgi:hypothetical protein
MMGTPRALSMTARLVASSLITGVVSWHAAIAKFAFAFAFLPIGGAGFSSRLRLKAPSRFGCVSPRREGGHGRHLIPSRSHLGHLVPGS